MALNARQKLFCDNYLVCLNATQAAKQAGYSAKTARATGQENLTKPDIKTYIKKRQLARMERTQITQDFVLLELAKIAMASGTDFATVGKRNRVMITPTEELPPEKRAAVASIKKGKHGIEVKTYDKVRALELLGKHLGLFDGRGGQGQGASNNLFEAIQESTGEDVNLSDLPEIQQTPAPGLDLVEPADTETP